MNAMKVLISVIFALVCVCREVSAKLMLGNTRTLYTVVSTGALVIN